MNLIESIVQTIIFILTEIFPISSSGHFAIIRHFRGGADFSSIVFIIVRFCLIIPIIFVFRKTFAMLIKEIFNIFKDIKNKKFTLKSMTKERKMFFFTLISTVLFSVVFVFTRDISKRLSSDLDVIVEGVFLIVSGGMLFFADRKMPGNKVEVDLLPIDSAGSGVLKGLSSLPGFTGTGSVLSFLIYRGFNREFANSIAIIMLLPSLIFNNIFEIIDLPKNAKALGGGNISVIIAISLVLGFLVIKLLQVIIKSDRLNIFANYMLVVGGIVTILGVIESVLDITIYDFLANVLSLLT